MNQRILIARPIPLTAVDRLRSKGYIVDVRTDIHAPSKRELIKILRRAPYTTLVSFLTDTIDAAVFDACPTLTMVANYAVGFNNVDIIEAKKRNIVVTNTQGTSGNAVAEFTVSLMCALVTRLVEGDRFVRAKKYKGWDPYLLLGTDIAGKVVGLIGAGEIGSLVAKKLINGFDCSVIYYDVHPNETLNALGATYMSQEEVLERADIVSLHVPLLPTTTHLINEKTLALMKPSAFLINTSRGPVIDEAVFTKALVEKKIAGAALDVFEFEPTISRTLRHLENVILTPHIASARVSVRESMGDKVAENIIAFTEGGALKNLAQ